MSQQRRRKNRQGCAHQRRRYEQHQTRQQEAPKAEREESRLKLLPNQGVEIVDPAKQEWDQQRVDRDANLQPPVNTQRLADAMGQASGERAAERESTHKRGEHRTDSQRSRAEDESEHARPQHFINQTRRAREHKAKPNQSNGFW